MTRITYAEILAQYKSRFSLIVEQILALALGTNLVKGVKNLPLKIKRIPYRCFKLYITLIQIDGSILS